MTAEIFLIAAMGRNRELGRAGDMPWRIPRDWAHFKAHTLGLPVIMGRRTYESIGRALPGRRNIVLTGRPDWKPADAEIAHDFPAALKRAETGGAGEIAVIGGQKVYETAMPRAHRMELTFIEMDIPDADTFFPPWDGREWRETHCRRISDDPRSPAPYTFATFLRI